MIEYVIRDFLTYHDVAYSTNILAAFDIATRASFETLTPSGSCKTEFYVYHNYSNNSSVHIIPNTKNYISTHSLIFLLDTVLRKQQ